MFVVVKAAYAYLPQLFAGHEHKFLLPEAVDVLSVVHARRRIFCGEQGTQGGVGFIQLAVNYRYLRFQFRLGLRQ